MRKTTTGKGPTALLNTAILETLETRRLLCGLPHELLAPVPAAFDWNVERDFKAQQRGGPESMAVGITFANKGQASDGFSQVFGTSANAARAVVDAVFAQWSRIITSFNRSDGSSTLQINVAMAQDEGGNYIGGFGAAGGPEAFPQADHKPRLGSITIGGGTFDSDPNNSNGWYFDPTPMDNAEFLGQIHNAYDARATNTGQGVDFFSVVAAETAHCLGIISDVNNTNGPYGDYTLEDFSEITNVRDNAEGSGLYGFFQVFNGPNIKHLMTSYNSGDATSLSWGNVIHTSGPGNLTFNGINYVGIDDDGNALYDGRDRIMPSFVVARVLADAYNYSIVDPATFATAHTVLNTSNGVLTVRGSSSFTSSDTIILDVSGSDLLVTVDIGEDVPGSGALPGAGNLPAYITRVPLSSINSIVVNGGGGQDFIRIERNGGKATAVNGEAGDDFIDFGFYNRNLSNQTANVNVNGGSGFDQIFVYDNAVASSQAFTLTSSRFDRAGWGGFFYDTDLELLSLTTGLAGDTVNVRSTFAGQPVYLNSAGGADTVNVGGSIGLALIAADVNIANSPALTTLNINDTGSSTARNAFIDFAGSPSFSRITNLAPAKVIWTTADVSVVNVTTGNAADSLLVYSINKPLNVNSAGGNDNVQIGDAVVGGLPFISGAINVNNSNGFTNLTVTDAGDNVAKNANLNFAGNDQFGRVNNLSPTPIIWVNARMAQVNIVTGQANDSMLVNSNNTNLRLDSAGGDDTVFIGAFSVGGLQFVGQTVSVDNSNGSTLALVDDLGTTTTKNSVTITDTPDAYTQITGFAPGTLRFNESQVSTVQVRSGNVTGILPDDFDILSSAVPLFFFNNGGPDSVNLGGGPLGADGIIAPVTVSGEPGSTGIGLLDFGSAVGRAMTLDDDGAFATVSGFGPVNHVFNLQTITSMAFSMGQAADSLAILRARQRVTYGNLHAGDPTDFVTIGNSTNGLDDIDGNIESGILQSPVALALDDSVNSAARTYNFQPQFFVGNPSTNRIVFDGTHYVAHPFSTVAESVSISAGSGDDTFNVPIARTTPFYLNGAGGNDTFNLATHASQFSDPVYLLGDGGLDVLNVNADSASTGSAVLLSTIHFSDVLLGTGGAMTVAGGGDKLLYTQNLTLGDDSIVDLVDNDMILDYAGDSQLATVQAMINAMRNGGAWDGTRGITSSFAATSTPDNNTLGAMESLDFQSIYGGAATFDGETLDESMVLVKHTYYGDADFNGKVDGADYARIDATFNLEQSQGDIGGWMNGDFDGNGKVDGADYALIDAAFNSQGSQLRPARTLIGVTPTRSQARIR